MDATRKILVQMGDREKNAQIDDVAALWVARLDARELSQAEESELDSWLACDVRHAGAVEAAARVELLDGPAPAGERFSVRTTLSEEN